MSMGESRSGSEWESVEPELSPYIRADFETGKSKEGCVRKGADEYLKAQSDGQRSQGIIMSMGESRSEARRERREPE